MKTVMKTALITGASGGIGRACVERFREAGYGVVAVARDLRSLENLGEGVTAIEASVATEEGRRAIAASVASVDALVHVAGINPREPLASMQEVVLREAFEVNFFAPVLLTQALAPRIASGGAVIFVTSTLAQRAAPAALAYAASKAAFGGAMRVLSLELGARGVRALAVAPGLVDTAMMREGRSDEDVRALAALSPLGRVGEAGEVAELIVAAAENGFMSGAVIPLDGGMTAGFAR
jgi:NAD(P)-dependent dehydrogenase (short-subunit alcohol dehydrogenase family)